MSTFKFNTTVQLIKGGTTEKGHMLMKGVASTTSRDTDGHTLDPKGFDTSYFLQKGFMNWNHEWKKNPLSIIGRPNKAFVNDQNELEIQYELFKGHKTAEEVYQLAEILEQNNLNLGLSIEGEVVSTDPKDKNKITKARITDCAITPHPKNSGTITSIIKGNDFKELVDFDKLGDFSIGAEGELLVKGTDTATADELMPESVEGMNKKKKKKKEDDEEEGDEKIEKSLSKQEVLEQLRTLNKSITLETADAIFDYTVKFQKSLQMTQIKKDAEVSQEALDGALEKLGLMKGQGAPAGDPPPSSDGEEEEEEDDKKKKKKPLVKAIEDMTEEERATHKEELIKSLSNIEALESKSPKPSEDIVGQSDELPVNVGSSELIKAIGAEIIKSRETTENLINEKMKAVGTLVNEQTLLVKGLQERLEQYENEPQQKRAVLTKGFVPKPGDEIQKGAQGEGEKVFSLSQNKHELCTFLTDKAIEKAQGVDKIDARLKADLIGLEAGNHLSQTVVDFAKSLDVQIID